MVILIVIAIPIKRGVAALLRRLGQTTTTASAAAANAIICYGAVCDLLTASAANSTRQAIAPNGSRMRGSSNTWRASHPCACSVHRLASHYEAAASSLATADCVCERRAFCNLVRASTARSAFHARTTRNFTEGARHTQRLLAPVSSTNQFQHRCG